MTPGPQLHRSITLWAGLITILFTCWVWRDSTIRNTSLYGGHIDASSTVNGLFIWYLPAMNVPWEVNVTDIPDIGVEAQWKRLHFPEPFLVHHRPNQNPAYIESPTLKVAMQIRMDLDSPGSWALFLPYWTIVLTLLLIWTALLVLRARRRKRSLHATPHPPL